MLPYRPCISLVRAKEMHATNRHHRSRSEDGGAGAEEGVAIHAHALQRAPREPDGLLPALRAPAPDTVGTHEPALLLTLSANRARQRGRGRHAAGRE